MLQQLSSGRSAGSFPEQRLEIEPRVNRATFYQSALRHEQHKDVTTSSRTVVLFRVDSSETG